MLIRVTERTSVQRNRRCH